MVVVVDDENRENEATLFSAKHVDSEKINFMAKHARGLVCLALDKGLKSLTLS